MDWVGQRAKWVTWTCRPHPYKLLPHGPSEATSVGHVRSGHRPALLSTWPDYPSIWYCNMNPVQGSRLYLLPDNMSFKVTSCISYLIT